MFMDIVFSLLAALLVSATTMALYLGLFRCGRSEIGPGRKALCGALSGSLALLTWGLLYTQTYLGW
ncbi:MAG: hypothetical protein H0S85_06815 [Desulfovibrionaceae bacterium]|jgi:hypothetical protein|nr:hypothetical protein [Desulfovibrionaceae bacterium]